MACTRYLCAAKLPDSAATYTPAKERALSTERHRIFAFRSRCKFQVYVFKMHFLSFKAFNTGGCPLEDLDLNAVLQCARLSGGGRTTVPSLCLQKRWVFDRM